MAAGLVSPVFAGREAELMLLAGAFEDAAGGTPRTVLTGAEAGGGKSRLVTEFTATVADRAMVLAGGCVELGAGGLPYAPFTAALRLLVRGARRRGGGRTAAWPDRRRTGRAAARFRYPASRRRPWDSACPPLRGAPHPARDPGGTTTGRPGRRGRGLVNCSTCDLLSFLVRNIRQARVLLMVTFRSDEINRNDLLWPLLAGLALGGGGVTPATGPAVPAPRPRCSSRASWGCRRSALI